MQVKRFVAANMRLALKMVREEMGPDAVILSNKRSGDGVELLIALESVPQFADTEISRQSATPTAQQIAYSNNPFRSGNNDSLAAEPTAAASHLELEIERMRREAKQRARSLASVLGEKSKGQLKEATDTDRLSTSSIEATLPDDIVHFTSAKVPLNKSASVLSVEIAKESIASEGEPLEPIVNEVQYAAAVRGNEEELSQMRFELQSMRDLLERQFSSMSWGQFSQSKPHQASLWKRLKRIGIGATIASELLDSDDVDPSKISRESIDTWQTIMTDLTTRLPVAGSDTVGSGGIFAFVGPTGAGKTTTIGKLATRYVLENGAENVALVTTDTVRIAAHEQLRTFGRILKVPVCIVDKNNSLDRVLHSLRHKSLVLIDTAGLNRQDPKLQSQLSSLNELGDRVQSILVIPTTSQSDVVRSAYHTYKTDNMNRCVLTKLDETMSLGGALSVIIDKSLSVAYSTNGQAIPGDIVIAKADYLVRTAIDLARHSRADDESMADELATLTSRRSHDHSLTA
jgi:flagellar biosynthesis protein FlhF|tara:strand:- start:9547 stop:11094 length:1548 start_codon:yes stop_codon:yes gene_type:complete